MRVNLIRIVYVENIEVSLVATGRLINFEFSHQSFYFKNSNIHKYIEKSLLQLIVFIKKKKKKVTLIVQAISFPTDFP